MTPDLPIKGGCRCGRVRFRLTEPPIMETACHCRGCQRMTGSAFSTTVIVPESGFEMVEGLTAIGGLHGEEADHHYCDWCKSWVFTQLRGGLGIINVRATLLDDASWFTPWMETRASEKLPWVETGVQRSFAGFPAADQFQGLIAEYLAARRVT